MVKEYSLNELVQLFEKQVKKSKTELAKFNLVVIGQTGTGKSTIINGVFQKPLAPAAAGVITTTVGIAYTETLKYYLKAQISGKVIPLRDRIQIFKERLTSFTQPSLQPI